MGHRQRVDEEEEEENSLSQLYSFKSTVSIVSIFTDWKGVVKAQWLTITPLSIFWKELQFLLGRRVESV